MKKKIQLIKKSKFIILNISYLCLALYQPTLARNPIDQSLFSAVLSGSTQQVKQAILDGANVNSVDEKSNSALAVAVKNGHIDIVQLLVKKGSAVDHRSDKNETLLHLAAQNGHVEIARFLLQKKPDMLNTQNDLLSHTRLYRDVTSIYPAKTPLHYATQNGHSEVARLLVQQKANISIRDIGDFTALHYAAQEGHTEIVRLFLDNYRDIEDLASNEGTPLFLAAQKGHTEIVRLLLTQKRKINVDVVVRQDWMTPLLWAAQNGYTEIAKLLLEYGADIEKRTLKFSRTALHLAILNGHSEIVKLLLEYGANTEAYSNCFIDHTYYDRITTLHLAAQNGNSKIVRLLLEYGADIKAKDNHGRTALHLAALNGHSEIVKLLLEYGAHIEALIPYSNKKALDLALEKGHSTTVKILLDNGVSPEISNRFKQTALHLATLKGHSDVMELLLKTGAQVHTFSDDNRTSLDYAFAYCAEYTTSHGQIRISKINSNRIKNIFIKLLLWHNYQSSSCRTNTHDSPIYQSTEKFIRAIEALNFERLPADKREHFDQARDLIRWIFNETSNCQSKKEFLAKILNYLLGSNPVEQQDLLRENIKNLLLKNYLLNKENPDFYDLKSTFSSNQLQELQNLENFLRYTYAKQLKEDLFDDISKEDSEHKLNDLKKEDRHLTALGKITNYRINHPIMQYCNNSLIEAPLKDSILAIDEVNRRNTFIQWVQELRDGIPTDENLSTHDTPRKALWSKWGRSYLASLQQQIYNYLNSITIQNRSITPLIKWIQQHYNNRFLGSTLNDLSKKELSSKAIWSKWGASYLEDSTKLLTSIYNHLDYIIKHKGTKINSDTEFGRNKIDILKFEKEKTTEENSKK